MSFLTAASSIALAVLCLSSPATAQRATVDDSSVYQIYRLFERMQAGSAKADVSGMLDTVLSSRAYRTMFRHYNRSWRPNHLPPAVFKRMIMSLQFPTEYAAGENQRADQMLPLWRRFYGDLPMYRANLRQLEQTNLPALVASGVRDARAWLPADWRGRDFYVPIMPHGGSSAFAIDSAQSYDFFQLPRDSSGTILWDDLRSTIAHETHHLSLHPIRPASLSLRDSVVVEFLSLFMPEGTATKFVNNAPGGCSPAVDITRTDKAFGARQAEWWARYTTRERPLFERVGRTFEGIRSGAIGRDSLQAEIGSYWLAGYVSPVYFVGAELFGAIYHAYGKDGAFAAMRDVRRVLPMYDDALKTRPDILASCYVFPDSVMTHARAMASTRE